VIHYAPTRAGMAVSPKKWLAAAESQHPLASTGNCLLRLRSIALKLDERYALARDLGRLPKR